MFFFPSCLYRIQAYCNVQLTWQSVRGTDLELYSAQRIQLYAAALINFQSLRTQRDLRKPRAESLNSKMKKLGLLVET